MPRKGNPIKFLGNRWCINLKKQANVLNSKIQQAIVDNNLAGEPASDQVIANDRTG